MQLKLADEKQTVDVSEAIFGAAFNQTLVHQVVTAYMAGGRAGTRAQKNRSDVRGGGVKPWRQKGTGRARAGSIRSPLWRGGGVVFAARPQDHSQKVNRKMFRGAMRSILAELLRQERLVAITEIELQAPKTRDLVAHLREMAIERALIVTAEWDENLALASRNLVGVEVTDVAHLDPVSLVGAERVVMTAQALKKIEEWLG